MFKSTLFATVIVSSVVVTSEAFVSHQSSSTSRLVQFSNDEKLWGVVEEEDLSRVSSFNFPNPLAELGDMLKNFDDVMDDFFNKRMGNGEVFYGKRKYKPSGKVEANYNGGGFSDFRKMEAAREFREERARIRAEMKEKAAAERK